MPVASRGPRRAPSFANHRPAHRNTEQVRLELQQHGVGRRPAIHPEASFRPASCRITEHVGV
jgi:hypothetical protein